MISPDGNFEAIPDKHKISIINKATGRVIVEKPVEFDVLVYTNTFSWSTDGSYLAFCDYNYDVIIIQVK